MAPDLNATLSQSGSRPPFPVIVGVPRSGTTMLRFMLDAHPDLAIPPETGFLFAPAIAAERLNPLDYADAIMDFPPDAPAWRDFGLDRDCFVAAVVALAPKSGPGDVLRTFYALYAQRHGKTRSGDKTPMYLKRMLEFAAVIPEAHFIHIVRDGRDVALSWSKTWFAPSRVPSELVALWASAIRQARAAAPYVHYLEVRYEDLLLMPAAVIQRICHFIDLSYTPRMLSYFERSSERLEEHKERVRKDGSVVVSRADRLHQQWRTTQAPQTERIGVWRTEMSVQDVAACIAASKGLLSL